MLEDIQEKKLLNLRWSEERPFAVYLYTPWCGTCQMGERMLNVVTAMEPEARIWKSNVNFLPAVVHEWKIESVPCLAMIDNRRIVEKVYTMRSVDFLLAKVRERLL